MYRFYKQKINKKEGLISIGEAAGRLGVAIMTLRRWDKSGKLVSVRSGPRGRRFYRIADIEQFIQDPAGIARKWAEAHQGVEPANEVYCETRDIFQARLETLNTNLARELSIGEASLITAIAGEIGNNSFDHNLGNWPDVIGVFFSYSLKSRFVVLADRGQGILKTLKRVKPDLSNAQEALKAAFTETISGRPAEARGNGLKFVRKVVVGNPFNLYFQTGGAYLNIGQGSNDVAVKKANSTLRGCFAKISF